MTKIRLLLVCFIISVSVCISGKNTDTVVIGVDEKFHIEGFNHGIIIILKPDYRFYYQLYSRGCMGGFYYKNVQGNYQIDSVRNVTFDPQIVIFVQDDFAHGLSSTTTIDTVLYCGAQDSHKIPTNYKLLGIEDVSFLVPDSLNGTYDEDYLGTSNFIVLANLYNSNDRVNTKERLLASKDTILNYRKLDIENIPEKWQKYFLKTPITAKIKSAKVIKRNELFPSNNKLTVISENGFFIPHYTLEAKQKELELGMKMYGIHPKHGYVEVTIVEISEKLIVAEGEDIFYRSTKLKNGTILSTQKETNLADVDKMSD